MAEELGRCLRRAVAEAGGGAIHAQDEEQQAMAGLPPAGKERRAGRVASSRR